MSGDTVFDEDHMQLCYRVARQMVVTDPDFVDDAAQWAGIYVWRLLRRKHGASPELQAKAAHFGVLYALRRRRDKEPRDGGTVPLSAFGADPAAALGLTYDPWEQVDLHRMVVDALRLVSDELERRWLALRFLEGWDGRDAAAEAGLSQQAFYNRWRRRTRDRLVQAMAVSG